MSAGRDGISVLMSVYQKENPAYFKEAMDSVINQSRRPDEIVLIQDGPLTDELYRLIGEYRAKDCGLVCFSFQKNVQLGRGLQKGVELCSNELIARMDTDDIAVPDRLLRQEAFMREHPEIGVCGGWMEEFSDDGSIRRVKQMPREPEQIRRYALKRNPVNHMTVMMRRSEVLRAGNYRHCPGLEDYHLWSRMMVQGTCFYNLPEVLVRARANEDLYGRRGGFAYMKRYLGFRGFQQKIGFLTGREYLYAVCITVGITIVPSKVRKLLYKAVLRR